MSVTLKQIAQRAGVSVRTVTRSLKREPGGNPETCKRVREIAETLGYVPNIAARNLRIKNKNIVAMIISSTNNDVASRKHLAVQRRLESENVYSLIGILPTTELELRSMLRNWVGLVKAVIFFNWDPDWDPHVLLGSFTMPFIFVDCMFRDKGFVRLEIDRASGIQKGIEYLLSRGYKQIAKFGSTQKNRFDGFRNAFKATGRRLNKDLIYIFPKNEFEDGYAAGKVIRQGNIDAVFFDTDRMAMGFLKYSYEHDIRIPDDIAVIGFDDDPAGVYSCPALSSVAHPIEEMSTKIVELTKNEVNRSEKILLPTRFIRRESA